MAIVGGGPAGSAAALALRAHAPSLSVVLIEASSYDTRRVGETLPPMGQRLLEQLGVWEAFQREPHEASYATAAAWGQAEPYEQPTIYSPYGRGWHLDRCRFDAWLAAQAESRGTRVSRATRVQRVERTEDGWRIDSSAAGCAIPAGTLRARMVVDATGASAFVARRAGARMIATDRLISFVQAFDEPSIEHRRAASVLRVPAPATSGASILRAPAPAPPVDDPPDRRTLVEAFSDGWWYTATIPTGGRIVACFTDPDIARARGLADPARFVQLLAAMPCIRRAVGHATPTGPLIGRSVGSRRLEPAAGTDWIAVGDAASRFDPLSSQGILKALRSGAFAAYAIADRLLRHDAHATSRYARFIRDEFDSYLHTRARYYGDERRWPDSPFWHRHARVTADTSVAP